MEEETHNILDLPEVQKLIRKARKEEREEIRRKLYLSGIGVKSEIDWFFECHYNMRS